MGGTVAAGSILRHGDSLSFRLSQDTKSLPVVYVGTETLPDTFKDGAQAIVQGNYTPDGAFQATHVQAKCASKYQAAPPGPKHTNMTNMSELEDRAAPNR